MTIVLRTCCFIVLLLSVSSVWADGPFRWKFQAGDRFSYSVVQDMNISGGGGVPADLDNASHQQLDVTWEVASVSAAGEATVRFHFDRIRTKMTLPTGGLEFDSSAKGPAMGMAAINSPLYQALVKSPVEITISPTGRITGVKLPADVLAALKRIPTSAAFGDLTKSEAFQTAFLAGFPILPPEDALPQGHQWSVKSETPPPVAGSPTIETNYRYDGMREVDGKPMAVIRPTRTFSLGVGELAQRAVKEQTSEGEYLFDATAGRLHASTLKHVVVLGGKKGEANAEQKIDQTIQVTSKPRSE
jgi:hypothetical protein